MLHKVKLPPLADEVEIAAVTQWKVEEGDYVEERDTLVVMRDNGDTYDVQADTSGIVSQIKLEEGDLVHVGDVLCNIELVEQEFVKEDDE